MRTVLVEELGAESFVHAVAEDLTVGAGKVVVRWDRRTPITNGEEIHLIPKSGEVFFFSSETGLRIRS